MERSERGGDWRPSATIEILRQRACLIECIRSFFQERGVLEVETPLLGATSSTELHLASFEVRVPGEGGFSGWLQTSPEFAMKRLLAAGSGPIFQITKAFRAGEGGRLHNPEFSMLEWYRPGFEPQALVSEIESLLHEVIGPSKPRRMEYAEAFLRFADIDPFRADLMELREHCHDRGWLESRYADRDACLSFLLDRVVQQGLGSGVVTLFDFPASQASLARLRPDDRRVAERFEVFVNGIEVGNGYRELADAAEQQERFERDCRQRREQGLPDIPVDQRLLSALREGLPDCSGVALGVDRLVMIATGSDRLEEVTSFPFARA